MCVRERLAESQFGLVFQQQTPALVCEREGRHACAQVSEPLSALLARQKAKRALILALPRVPVLTHGLRLHLPGRQRSARRTTERRLHPRAGAAATARDVRCQKLKQVPRAHHRPVDAPGGTRVPLLLLVLEAPRCVSGWNFLSELEGGVLVATEIAQRLVL